MRVPLLARLCRHPGFTANIYSDHLSLLFLIEACYQLVYRVVPGAILAVGRQ